MCVDGKKNCLGKMRMKRMEREWMNVHWVLKGVYNIGKIEHINDHRFGHEQRWS